MLLLRQLEFAFHKTDMLSAGQPGVSSATERTRCGEPGKLIIEQADKMPASPAAETAVLLQTARELLRSLGVARIAGELRVEWNSRLKTAAGRADYHQKLLSLNPRLSEYPIEIDRTLRHELAHILAQFRAGRRRILPHGVEWRQACRDLGISDEKRCHNLPFPVSEHARRYLYRCPGCGRDFPRVRRLKRGVACLACCRAHNGGKFDARFRLRLMTAAL
jgi:SprT protein